MWRYFKWLIFVYEVMKFGLAFYRDEMLVDAKGKQLYKPVDKDGGSGGNVENRALQGLVRMMLLRGCGSVKR